MTDYHIELLPHSGINCLDLARWHFAEWQALYPGDSVESFATDLARCRDDRHLPLTWVLLDEAGTLAGSVSILESDLDSEPRLTPWLANLWIHPDARQRGLGSRLLAHACDVCWQHGNRALYLYTPDQAAFYLARGWQVVRHREFSGVRITIMSLHGPHRDTPTPGSGPNRT